MRRSFLSALASVVAALALTTAGALASSGSGSPRAQKATQSSRTAKPTITPRHKLEGLVWGPARRVATSEHGLVDVSDLISEDGKHYLAFTGDDQHVRLASDAAGSWNVYDVYLDSPVGNGANHWYVGVAVQKGHVYVPFITSTDGRNFVAVAYTSNLQGPWAHYTLYATDASYPGDPFGTIAGGNLLVSFDMADDPKGNADVFVASLPLSELPAAGAPINAPRAAQIINVSKVDDVQAGPTDAFAEIVPWDNGFYMAWERGEKSLVYAQGQLGNPRGTTWPTDAEVLHTASDASQQSLQVAAAGHTVVIGRFIPKANQGDSPACCDVFATTNASGGWSTEIIGGTNLALQKPGVAVSACGPSVAYQQAVRGGPGRLTIATFAGGHWIHQSLAADVEHPRLAPTPDGLDLIYKSGYGDIYLQHAKCYPPAAP